MAKSQTKTNVDKKSREEKTRITDGDAVIAEYVCNSCGGNDYSGLGELPTTQYGSELPDGTAYKAIGRKLVRCRDCGQAGVEKRFIKG